MADENTTSNGEDIQGNGALADICVVETMGEDGLLSSAVSRPGAGETLEVLMLPGQKYAFNFPESDVEDFAQADGNLILKFADGSSIILQGFDEASNADIPALVAFDDAGRSSDIVEVAQAAPDEDVLEEPQAQVRGDSNAEGEQTYAQIAQLEEAAEILAKTEPAAGEVVTAEELAQVEPAAGETGAAAQGNSNTGFGFGSATQSAPLVSPDAVGPLLRTALNYGIQQPQGDLFIAQVSSLVASPEPTISAPLQFIYEDTAEGLGLSIVPGTPSSILDITITGIPSTWTVDANGGAYDSATGTWTFTTTGGTFSGGPILTPPYNSDVDLSDLELTVVEKDASGNVLFSPDPVTFDVIVDADADEPYLVAQNVSDVEDAVQGLNITTDLVDTDGTEVIQKLVIEDVPSGFTLNHGTYDAGTGFWTVSEADLATLTITPPAHFNGSIDLIVESFSEELHKTDADFDLSNDVASTRYEFTVTWTPTIDPPDIKVNNGIDEVQVKEDGTIDVTLEANLNANHDPVEFLTVTVTGIDSSWGFSAPIGSYDSVAGTWTYTAPADTNVSTLLTFTPPAQSDIDLTGLVATVVATDPVANISASSNDAFHITVDVVADLPTVAADDESGIQGVPLDVDFSGALGDDNFDGSESIVDFTLSDVPDTFTLTDGGVTVVPTSTAGGFATYVFAAGTDVSNLQLVPPANYTGTTTLQVTINIVDTPAGGADGEYDLTDNTNSATTDFDLTWTPRNPPSITVNGGVDEVRVKEDSTVDVTLTANLGAGHTATEVLTVTVTGIDSSWGFSAPIGTYDSAAGTWTFTAPANTDISTLLTFTPPPQSDIDLTGLQAHVSVVDTAVPGLSLTAPADDFFIMVDAVADLPTVSADDDIGAINTALDVDFSGALGDDNFDGSESIVDFTLSAVPDTFTLMDNGVVVAPTSTAGGFATYVFAAGTDVSNLTLLPSTGYKGTTTLQVTINTVDTPAGGADGEYDLTDNTNSATTDLDLTWTDVPTVTVNSSVQADVHDAQVKEDGSIDLTVVGEFGAVHTATSILTVTVTGIDSSWGFTPTIGTYDSVAGTWTYTAAANTEISTVLNFTPPAQSDVDMNGLKAVVTLVDPANSINLSSADHNFKITVDAVADKPDVDVANKTIDEGMSVALNVVGSLGADAADGSESITGYQITGVPSGFSFSAGTVDPGDSTVWNFTPAQIVGLNIIPPNASYVGVHNFNVIIFNEETTLSGGEYDLADNTNFDTDAFTITWSPDDVPVIAQATAVVDETNLAPTTTDTGVVSVDTGTDTLDSVNGNGTFQLNGLTSNGDLVTVVFDSATNVYTGTANGRPVFTFTITNNSTGAYNFTLQDAVDHPNASDPNDVLGIAFGIIAEDSDGSTSTGFVNVNIYDDGPVIIQESKAIDESGLDNGPIVITRDLNFDYGEDGAGDVSANGDFLAKNTMSSLGDPVYSHGELVTITQSGNGYIGTSASGTVFTLSIDSVTGEYTYTQFEPIDHPDAGADVIWLKFGVEVTDYDNDTDDAYIIIDVTDDVPVAVSDSGSVGVGGSTSGNILTNDDFGVDLPGTLVSINGQPIGGGLTITTGLGTLVIQPNGSYTYTDGPSASGGQDSFTYVIRDADGDTATATLFVNVEAAPVSSPPPFGGGDGGGDSPLVLDINNDGVIGLTNAEGGVQFDIDVDGVLEQTAWVGTDDAFLVLDDNGDGLITDRSELFGDTDGFTDGFDKLSSFDSNDDGVVDAQDDVWSDLRVWQDVDHDGVSDAAELLTLEQLDIVSFNLTTTQPAGLYIEGNWISHVGSYTTADGEEHLIVDAWFQYDENPLYATDEADSFVIDTLSTHDASVIGFDAEGGDTIDISSLLDEAEDDVSGAISDFVSMREEDGNTIISVDLDGSGAGAAQDIVTLSGTIDLDIGEMIDNGSLIV